MGWLAEAALNCSASVQELFWILRFWCIDAVYILTYWGSDCLEISEELPIVSLRYILEGFFNHKCLWSKFLFSSRSLFYWTLQSENL